MRADGRWLRVERVEAQGGRRTVYNLEVEHTHTYVVGKLGAWVHNTCNPKELLELAKQVQGNMPPWVQTVSVLKTAEGPTLVGAGVKDLTVAQKAVAQKLGLVVTEMAEAHAEQTVLTAAGKLGLTPTVGAATNNVCSGVCKPFIVDVLKGWVEGKFYGF